VNSDELVAALQLPAIARVDQRIPKKLLLENGAASAADRRLINEGIEEIHWLAALKPAAIGVPELRDTVRDYMEIAVLKVGLRDSAKVDRLIELIHRAVPYPLLLLVESTGQMLLSLAHKRRSLNEAGAVVTEGTPVTVSVNELLPGTQPDFAQALALAHQPKANLWSLYQGWIDVLAALEASRVTGVFAVLDSDERNARRREALQQLRTIDEQIKALCAAADKASQTARLVEINLQLVKLRSDRTLEAAHL